LTLSDGTVSEQFGEPGKALVYSYEFSDTETIESIKMLGDYTVDAIQFCGEKGEILIQAGDNKLLGKGPGQYLPKKEAAFSLNDGESFVGI